MGDCEKVAVDFLPTTEKEKDTAYRYRCFHCFESVVAQNQPNFCVHCGFRLDEKCQKCKADVKFAEKFCSSCGTKNSSYVYFPSATKACFMKLFLVLIFLLAIFGGFVLTVGIYQYMTVPPMTVYSSDYNRY